MQPLPLHSASFALAVSLLACARVDTPSPPAIPPAAAPGEPSAPARVGDPPPRTAPAPPPTIVAPTPAAPAAPPAVPATSTAPAGPPATHPVIRGVRVVRIAAARGDDGTGQLVAAVHPV